MKEKKVISVDPMIPFFLVWTAICLVAGIFVYGMFLAPPPPEPVDLKAEYCRGVGDGEFVAFNAVYEHMVGIEKRLQEGDPNAQLLAISVYEGQEADRVRIVDTLIHTVPPEHMTETEAACYRLDPQEMIDAFGARGPSNYVSPTTTLMGGANIPERDE